MGLSTAILCGAAMIAGAVIVHRYGLDWIARPLAGARTRWAAKSAQARRHLLEQIAVVAVLVGVLFGGPVLAVALNWPR